MRSLIAVAAVLTCATTASAEPARMNSLEFSRAAECLAYSDIAALKADAPDLSALQERFAAAMERRPSDVREETRTQMRRVRFEAGQPDSAEEVARVSAMRDRACRRFIDQTTTASHPAVTPASP